MWVCCVVCACVVCFVRVCVRRAPLRRIPLCQTPPPDPLPLDRPKFRFFVPSSAPIFALFSLSLGVFSCFFFSLWGSSRRILVVFLKAWTLKLCTSGCRAKPGRPKKKREIFGGPAETGPGERGSAEGGPAEGGSCGLGSCGGRPGGHTHAQNTQHTHTQNNTPTQHTHTTHTHKK